VEQLLLQIKEAKAKASSLKTKKAKEKAWTVIRDLEHQVFIKLHDQCDKYRTMSVKATVKSFHEGDDHMLVSTPYGNLWISPCNDVLTKSWYPHTCCITYTVGQEIVLEIDTEVNSERLFLELIPKTIYGGIVDEKRYEELCKQPNLAFFKYPNSDGVTGLFA